MTDPGFHPLADGRRLAFRHRAGDGPAVVFLPGYRSDMAGAKALALWDWAERQGRECLMFDYSGCGESSGDFADGTLSRWRDEGLALIAAHVANRVVLVGSSMGGWLMLLIGQALGDRLAALVGIAAAPDYTEWGFDAAQQRVFAAGETLRLENPYGGEGTPIHAGFWSDGQALRQLERPIALDVPARLLHGEDDGTVPPDISLRLARALRSQDVQVTLVKGADHRLSRDGDIALLLRTVAALD